MNIMCLFFFCYIALLSGFVIYQTIQHCSPYIIISHSLLVLNCIWPSCISYSAPLSSQLLPASVFSRAGESLFAVMSVRCLPPWKRPHWMPLWYSNSPRVGLVLLRLVEQFLDSWESDLHCQLLCFFSICHFWLMLWENLLYFAP